MASIFDSLFKPSSTAQAAASVIPYLRLPKKQAAYLRPYQETVSAMTDLSNPMYQKLYGQFRQQGQQNLAETISELQGQNRMNAALGRVPLFSGERGSEQIFRNLTKGYQDLQNTAATNAINTLSSAASNQLPIIEAQQKLAENQAGVKSGLYGALAKLFRL